jgi:ABC-type uncharacterized transport system substrate-binding protein
VPRRALPSAARRARRRAFHLAVARTSPRRHRGASRGDDFGNAFAEIRNARADALFVSETMTPGARRQIVEFATKNRLPVMFMNRDYVAAGGLMSYAPNFPEMYRQAAAYVDKILKGAKPADLPVEQPTKFELVINLKTAKALGLTIPQSLLSRADQVIE